MGMLRVDLRGGWEGLMLRPPPERHALAPLPCIRCRAPYLSKDCRGVGGVQESVTRIDSNSLAFSKCLHALTQLIAISARALVVVVRGHKCAQEPAELRQLHQFPALLAPDPHCLKKKKEASMHYLSEHKCNSKKKFRYPHRNSNGCRNVRASFFFVCLSM
jgi:hypothetical protein